MILQRRSRRLSGALLASLTLLWLAAPAAFAREGRRDSERRFDSHRGHRDHRDDDFRHRRGHGWRGEHWRGGHRGHPHGHHRAHGRAAHGRDAYYCRPCNRRFSSRGAFHGHLNHHHHVPIWAVPFLVIYWASAWTYHG